MTFVCHHFPSLSWSIHQSTFLKAAAIAELNPWNQRISFYFWATLLSHNVLIFELKYSLRFTVPSPIYNEGRGRPETIR